ncbi:hypothetical protein [Alteromonas sp.]|jgi:hypothetical protein|uniref:hypothetical protein n=1 Tax=Alteromonas sp. TaxID=232 RepID=UPI000B68B4A2|nr:hypothetical protein [Alteromonas sp.]MAI36033.1 hypothetical protein [Alteromonas sp.]OUX92395.1 MAG: hypothetical protein CBB95_00450 [Alteromonas sp. TMED35]|tara:strand:+ start:12340 stop:13962 length:1623 start_codon:yes stop_codon:yes gene_type:complete
MKTIIQLSISALCVASIYTSNAFGETPSEAIPIVNSYPDCNYEVLKEITLQDAASRLLHSDNDSQKDSNSSSVSGKQTQSDGNTDAVSLLKQAALLDAKELGASQIVLVSSEQLSDNRDENEETSSKIRSFEKTSAAKLDTTDSDSTASDSTASDTTNSNTTAFGNTIVSASLISSCNSKALAKIGVKRNRLLGTTKVSMSYEYSTVVKGRDMTFDFSDYALGGKKEVQNPELKNQVISFDNGVFGVKVEDDLSMLLETLGTPTAELILNDTDTLYVYGRNLWIVVRNNKVKSIQSYNTWLSAGLINYFEFDDRPFLAWQVNGSIGRGDDVKSFDAKLDGNLKEEYTYRLAAENGVFIDIGLTLEIDNENKRYVAKSFAYGYLDGNGSKSDSEIAPEITNSKPSIYEKTYSDLTEASQTLEPITIDQFPFTPILAARGYQDKTLHIYDRSLAMVYSNNTLRKLIVRDSFFKNVPPKGKWTFGPLQAGMNEEDVTALFGEENIFALGDYWEIYVDNLKYELYFAENDKGTMVLDELEVEMF